MIPGLSEVTNRVSHLECAGHFHGQAAGAKECQLGTLLGLLEE